MSLNLEEVNKLRKLYPLHYAVFENNISYLKELLESSENEKINQLDIHGRSPIMLATVLNHIDCAELLLKHGADANTQNKGIGFIYLCGQILDMWSLSHEAISLGNPKYLKEVLKYRDFQRAVKTTKILLDLRESLKVLFFFDFLINFRIHQIFMLK